MKKIFLVGEMKDCEIVADAFKRYFSSMNLRLEGLIVKNICYKENNYNVYDFSEYNKINKRKNTYFVQIGGNYLNISDNRLISLIHPESYVIYNSFQIGISNIIMPKVIIYQNVKMGNYNFVMNCVKIIHDVTIENNCFFNYYSIIGSNTVIKNYVSIGLKSSIRENLNIENYGKLEDGSILLRDIGVGETWKGNPAKKT